MPFDFAPDQRRQAGRTGYHDGLAAEDAVARHYEAGGARVLDRRWRGPGGEIDLVTRDAEGYVFVEVKKARTHDEAAGRLSARQLSRICASASTYLEATGGDPFANLRIDLALVDAAGRIDILRNVSLF